MKRPVTVELPDIIPGAAGFEYGGQSWVWKKTTSGFAFAGTDRKGLWGVFTNGKDSVRIYRGDVIEALGDEAAALIFNLQPYPYKCYAYIVSSDQIGVITRGEKGYHPVYIEIDGLDKRAAVDRLNAALGVSKAHAAAMMAGSLFGWDCPASRSSSYDANGKPRYPTALKKPELTREGGRKSNGAKSR